MKVFWAVLLVLILGSVAYLVMGRSGPSSGKSPAPELPSSMATTPSASRSTTPQPPPKTTPDNNESAFFPETKAVEKKDPEPLAANTSAPTDEPSVPEVKDAEVAAAPVEEKPREVKQAEAESSTTEKAPTPVAAAPAPPPSPSPAAADAGTGVAFGADAKVVKNDDGTLMVDDKYQLKGEGTEASPYEITWEYLVSAQEDYQPRLGKKKLPGRLKLIDHKRVKITGFVAFPIMAEEPTEMLAMLNQWDGCCIGIPPTPYDAVEVKLSAPASNEQRLVTYGTVEGKLSVEPYLVRDWLVSLYSLEDATMSRAQ